MSSAASNNQTTSRRILVIDDNEAIHKDFLKILSPSHEASDSLRAAEAALFGEAGSRPAAATSQTRFDVETASQGQEGYDKVAAAAAAGQPFAMAFVDMRMPPGWDGIETIENIWRDYPDIEMVICTAFSDYSWDETIQRLGHTDRLLIVKKPFDAIEILQAAYSLTHKWHVQHESQRVMDHLAELVSERTQEVEQARDELAAANRVLRESKELAEAANASKTMFLANMSHELRTPMTAIIGYSQELEERMPAVEPPSFEHEAVITIRRNAEHLLGLIGDLLDVAKMETGQLMVSPTACSPMETLSETMAIMVPKARIRGLRLTLESKTRIPATIQSDPLRIRQILVNLVDNAIKFTEQGGVRIEVGFTEQPEPRLVVEVHDTGIGMTEEAMQRIFLPFEQADASTTRRFGGSGLGLAISQQLAKLLGGEITVTSQPDVGTCFRVEVTTGPVESFEQADATKSAIPTAPPTTTAPLHAHVLLVEDGRDNQLLISHLLRKAGCEVEVAENGVQCLENVNSGNSYDLILMDMQMPVMGGIEATETLRKQGCATPIVALTANAMKSDEDVCLGAGCDAFLTKPINRGKLIETIRQHTNR